MQTQSLHYQAHALTLSQSQGQSRPWIDTDEHRRTHHTFLPRGTKCACVQECLMIISSSVSSFRFLFLFLFQFLEFHMPGNNALLLSIAPV